MAASAEEPHKAGRAESAASAERTACAEEEDRALVARTLAGDAPAFTTLVRRYQERVFRFVLRLCGTRDEALDLTQETFMKAHQALPGWRPEAQFRTWLFSIAHNATLDVLRRRQRVIFVPLAADSPDDAVAQRPDPGARPDERCADRQRSARSSSAKSSGCASWKICPTAKSRQHWGSPRAPSNHALPARAPPRSPATDAIPEKIDDRPHRRATHARPGKPVRLAGRRTAGR